MLRKDFSIVIMLVVCGLVSLVNADFVAAYDPIGSERPDASWTLTGSDPIASVSDGIALFTTSSSGVYTKTVDLDWTNGFTMDWRIEELSSSTWKCGMSIRIFSDSTPLIELRYYGIGDDPEKGAFEIQWPSGTASSTKVDVTSGMHTFRLAIQGSRYTVWVDGQDTALIDNSGYKVGEITSSDLIGMGDYGGSITGSTDFDFLKYDSTQAIFEAPIVPEPATIFMALIFGGALMAKRNKVL